MRLAWVMSLAACGRLGFGATDDGDGGTDGVAPDTNSQGLINACTDATADGVYTITGTQGTFDVYCNATFDGGGWALVMRFAADTELDFNSPYWTDASMLLNESGSLDPADPSNAKFASFVAMVGTTLLGCKGGVPATDACIVRALSVARTAQDTFSAAPDPGGVSRAELDAIFGANPSCPYCDTGGGINYLHYNEHVRFGTVGDFDANCGTPDASWGWGIRDDYSNTTCGAGKVGRGLGGSDCRQATLWIR